MRLDAHMLAIMRQRYITMIHNESVDVEVAISRTKVTEMPGYVDAQTEDSIVSQEFSDFGCSIYDLLSGKLSRIFRNKVYEQAMDFGIWDDVSYLVQYVNSQYILEARNGLVTNATPSNTILEDSLVDFTTLPIRSDFDSGLIGAQIINVSDGSTANILSVVALQIVTDGLVNGTDNLFDLGDSYQILNVNDLKTGDRVKIHNNWREVLAVVQDSEGIQHTVFTANG